VIAPGPPNINIQCLPFIEDMQAIKYWGWEQPETEDSEILSGCGLFNSPDLQIWIARWIASAVAP